MPLIIKDRVKETTTTTGTGTITLAGASTGFRSFADIGNANTTYYCISGGSQFEVGLGTYTASGTTLSRDTVLSNSLGTTALINFSAGTKDVFCTYPSEKALLGDTSAVSSTGTGSVVLNSNPTFATDITVNGLTVGKGSSNVATNTAFGFDALGSPYASASNVNNLGIGYNALNIIGASITSLTVLNNGSGYTDGTYTITLSYLSGTPIIDGGTYPTITVSVSTGNVFIDSLDDGGFGWTNTTTVFQYTGGAMGAGSGFTCQIASLITATNNTALGYNAGNTNLTGSNSVYIGSGATGTGSNEIVIGANAPGNGNDTVVIGNGSITSTTLRGTTNVSGLTATGTLSASGGLSLTGQTSTNSSFHTNQSTATITMGGASATGQITLGRSTITQTVSIANGATSGNATKFVNIGTQGTSASTTNINIGNNTTGGGTLNFGQATGTQTTNIQAGATASGSTKTLNIGTGGLAGSTTNIAIGSTAGTSTTTVNGLLKQQTYLVANLPTGSAGARSFVTNALSPTFGAAVAGGGAVGVPVYHDGTSWKVG